MPNTAKKPGKNDIKTFIKAVESKQAALLLDALNIKDEASHSRAVELVGDLMDITGDDPGNPAYRLIEIMSEAIAHYEEKVYPVPETTPVGVLRFLMEQNGLSQSDLKDLFGSQSIVSEILNGKRELNLGHVRKLAKRFNVPPAVFV